MDYVRLVATLGKAASRVTLLSALCARMVWPLTKKRVNVSHAAVLLQTAYLATNIYNIQSVINVLFRWYGITTVSNAHLAQKTKWKSKDSVKNVQPLSPFATNAHSLFRWEQQLQLWRNVIAAYQDLLSRQTDRVCPATNFSLIAKIVFSRPMMHSAEAVWKVFTMTSSKAAVPYVLQGIYFVKSVPLMTDQNSTVLIVWMVTTSTEKSAMCAQTELKTVEDVSGWELICTASSVKADTRTTTPRRVVQTAVLMNTSMRAVTVVNALWT